MALCFPKSYKSDLCFILITHLSLDCYISCAHCGEWVLCWTGQVKSWYQILQVALVIKNPCASAGDMRDVGSIPGLGRSPGGGNGSPLQCSCLKTPTERGVAKSRTWLKWLSTHAPHSPALKHALSYFISFHPIQTANQSLELEATFYTSTVFIFHSWVDCKLLIIACWWIGNIILTCDPHLSKTYFHYSVLMLEISLLFPVHLVLFNYHITSVSVELRLMGYVGWDYKK